MHDVAGNLHIVFNGEIYDFAELRTQLRSAGYVFRSDSDTEVILAAYQRWGVECVKHLNGMFAFAIYDAAARTLVLARDRAGEKPLYYSVANGVLRFASELKAIMADVTFERRVELDSLNFYLYMGFVPDERTLLRGVHKLPPAHVMSYDVASSNLKITRYWSPPAAPAALATDERELLQELETLLLGAVRRQMVADVPVGILLSGGVDSSLVTAMATRVSSDVKTFTVRFPGHRKHDETCHARLIADHFHTQHLELEAQPSSVDILPLLARQFDDPIVDSSMVPMYLISRLVREHCTVALGGDGGDELFGGYGHHRRLLWMQAKMGKVPQWARAATASVATRCLPVGFKGRNWLAGLGTDFDKGVPLIACYFDNVARARLLNGGYTSMAEPSRNGHMPAATDLLQRATRLDFENYLPGDILVKVDRASMLSSLEMRSPLLDYRLIEFAYGKVPSNLKATPHEGKLLLKRLAQHVLPPEFDLRRKQGFSIPLDVWISAGPWQAFFREVLLGADTIFARDAVEKLFDGQARGYSNSERLFALVFLELWRREYRVAM